MGFERALQEQFRIRHGRRVPLGSSPAIIKVEADNAQAAWNGCIGMGNFSMWIERLRDHYRAKTGMVLFPGTLNLQLECPWLAPDGCLRLEGAEYGGTVTVYIVPCSVLSRPAFILRTTANNEGRGHHPQTIIEIATDVKLRDAYQLKDGDRIEVEITDQANAS